MEYPKRKNLRLKDYDYSQNGYYFITICTKERANILSKIKFDVGADIIRPILTEYGKIAERAINAIPLHYPDIKIDKYIIMPDHIHLILIILNGRIISAPTASKPIMTVIGQMKRWVSKEIGFSLWQKSYYDHIIRNAEDYAEHLKYIEENPFKWIEQKEDEHK